MSRTIKFTVSVPGRLFNDLEAFRGRTGTSRSELVREALLRMGIQVARRPVAPKAAGAGVREGSARYASPAAPLRAITDAAERRKRALAAAGRFRSGVADLSSEHDKYLDDAYAAGGSDTKTGSDQKR